jgi:Domain of unknown function (DUF4160)
MPTIRLLLGWRILFDGNEGHELAHSHCRKGEEECKYWLDRENVDLEDAYAYNLSSRDRRELKKSHRCHQRAGNAELNRRCHEKPPGLGAAGAGQTPRAVAGNWLAAF